MLKLNQIIIEAKEEKYYLNTSHVKVKQTSLLNFKERLHNLNTSHVKVKLNSIFI